MPSACCRSLLPLLLLLAGALLATPPPRRANRLPSAEVYRRARAATAWVHAVDRGKGTGWVVDRSRRLLVTAAHVVGDNHTAEVVFPAPPGPIGERAWYFEHYARLRKEGLVVRGKVLRRSEAADLALVELESLPPGMAELPLAAAPARPGDRVHVVGNRYDTDALWGYSAGAVRQVQTLRDGYFCAGRQLAKGARVLVAQAPINEGDSGGALVNDRGEVVGAAAAVAWEMHGAGLFIDLCELRAFLTPGADPPVQREPKWSGSPPPVADPPGSPGPRDVYRDGLRCLALVLGEGPDAHASACLLDRERRLLLTSAEVVGRKETAEVFFPVYQDGRVVAEAAFYRAQADLLKKKGARVRACVLATDTRRNLALLEVESLPAEAAAVRLAAAAPAPGDFVHALGSPRRTAFWWAYAGGSVRQLGHVNLGPAADGPESAVVLVQAVLGEGESGGPLLSDDGTLLGILSGKSAPQQQISYALALAEVQAFLAETRPQSHPAGAPEYLRRAALFVKARDYPRALADLDEAVRLNPGLAAAHAERGRVLHLHGADDRALAACDEAVRLDARLPAPRAARAEVLCARGEWARARADCDEALRIDRGCARAFAVRGLARLLGGDTAGAIADCDEAIWLNRRLPDALLYRGRAHARLGVHDKAIADFSQALRLDPHLAETHVRRGDSHWVRGDVRAALEDYTEARGIDPRDPAAVCGCARAEAVRGQHDQALADFNAALRLDPRHAPAYRGRGAERLRRGDLDRAFADYRQALTLAPGLAADVLADAEARAGDWLRPDSLDPVAAADVCRRALETVRPFIKDNVEIQKRIDAALAVAEPDARLRAVRLRAAAAAVREALRPMD
jgi:tetratricopeptide (TPR) repeat protein/S1-C subfamily serine protease